MLNLNYPSSGDLVKIAGKMIVDAWRRPEEAELVLLFSDSSKLVLSVGNISNQETIVVANLEER